ncbi:hypothetical protein B0H65DRAFT_223910 [Neurospora tetraspora]|uniref:Uncharacterized protein n=1 Tax=Neurospora tetraspora TaxID=94610 RepID=A0AAE0JCB2_9PEZI|nr:hypothetical protein B0H65DRAFT_223910 [Neurospora tetraspora]
MTKLEATHQPNFSELEQWHYEEKRGADTEISFENWDEAMKKLVLGKTDEITAASWPSSWIFPHKNIDSETAFLFLDGKHPRLAYRLGYTYQVVHRHIKRLHKQDVPYTQDAFLSQRTPDGQTIWVQIMEFMNKFRDLVQWGGSLHPTARDKIGVFRTYIRLKLRPANEYI